MVGLSGGALFEIVMISDDMTLLSLKNFRVKINKYYFLGPSSKDVMIDEPSATTGLNIDDRGVLVRKWPVGTK